jgi:hypothetical protein
MTGYTMELAACESTLLREIATKELNREDIAQTYAMAIVSTEARNKLIDWKKVNEAIVERWSPSAREWIKNQAWKIIESHTKGRA